MCGNRQRNSINDSQVAVAQKDRLLSKGAQSKSMFSEPAEMTQSSWASELAKTLHRISGKAEEETSLNAATKCVLDYFSVVIAGFAEPVSVEVKKTTEMLGEAGMATVLYGGSKTSASLAALANGTAAHALDFDDTLWTYIGHCTAVIFSSALAVAEWLDCDGRQLLKGFTLGVEAAASHRFSCRRSTHSARLASHSGRRCLWCRCRWFLHYGT